MVTRLARLGLCRQSCLGFSSITFISSNWNDKLRSYSWDPSTLPVSTNPCQRGEIWWHSYRGERGHLQLLLQQRIPQNCWPNYSKFPNEIQSKQIIEIWDGIIEVVHQELYGNLNIWGSVIWQTFWPLLFFLSNTISYNFVLIILKCFSHNDFLPTKKCSPKKAEIFRNVYIINFHI